MVGHYDDYMQAVPLAVPMPAYIEHDVACTLRQAPAVLGAEGNEVLFIVSLDVRQVPAIVGHVDNCDWCPDREEVLASQMCFTIPILGDLAHTFRTAEPA